MSQYRTARRRVTLSVGESVARPLRYYANNEGAGKAEVVGPVFKDRDYGVAFGIGSDLRKQFDDALLSMREDGDYDALREKWLGPSD